MLLPEFIVIAVPAVPSKLDVTEFPVRCIVMRLGFTVEPDA
jgi:hypothetical protein